MVSVCPSVRLHVPSPALLNEFRVNFILELYAKTSPDNSILVFIDPIYPVLFIRCLSALQKRLIVNNVI